MPPSLTLSSKLSPFPYAAIIAAACTGVAPVSYDETASGINLDLGETSVTSEEEIVQTLARLNALSDDSIQVGESQRAAHFFTLATSLRDASSFSDIVSLLDSLDDHLAFRTFLAGYDPSATDWMVWGVLKGNIKAIGLLKNQQHTHLLRWFTYFESLPSTQGALAELTNAKANKARSNKTAAGFALGLQDAKMGEVVTRFPPEPSGYLHIGHTKAAILNQYFAKMYNGQLIVRFDDTNPTKERSEFEETILEDLKLLDIHGDRVTHTSDYFDQLYDYALQLIKAEKAYADDTEQQQMRDERFKGIASKHRDDGVEENLKHFDQMKLGTEEGLRWCIRAKISVDVPNKALRDPVIYRCNLLPHHRTGDKWKVYPTYDFACPIVDCMEGVTHALRTNEYRDRNPQYQWMLDALGLRKVHIWDYSRLNFIYTLLSKRKLHWFVDKGLVKGWDDPRFPTVRGIRRRGMTVEALTQFMLSQGPSQAVVSLEWDSIWTLNKKVIDPIAPRHWAIVKDKSVPVVIRGGPTMPEIKTLPKHKKNLEVGEKQTVYSSNIKIEQDDAASFEDQEEITLMDWGNVIIRSKKIDPSGQVLSVEVDLHLEGDFRKTKKKITWLAAPIANYPLVDVRLLDYDYIITKKKLEDDDNVADFVTPVTEFKDEAFADTNVRGIEKGNILQFERKGYFIYDGSVDGVMEFIRIPDGRAANLASKAGINTPADTSATHRTEGSAAENATTMYKMDHVYGEDLEFDVGTRMYQVQSVYT